MDTLIDNRNFPIEMQEQPEKEETNTTAWWLIVLVIFAVVAIAFLTYRLFSKPTTIIEKSTYERQVLNIQNIQKDTPQITQEERDRRVAVFFN